MYALNLGTDGRVLSATYPQYAPANAVLVAALPNGNLADYRYADGAFVYDPLPAPPMEDVPPDTTAQLQAQIDAILVAMAEV